MLSIAYLTGMSAIGGFLFGYDTSVVSGALVLIDKDFDLTDVQEVLAPIEYFDYHLLRFSHYPHADSTSISLNQFTSAPFLAPQTFP